MSIEGQKFYPGEASSPAEVLALAKEYRRAAQQLRTLGRRGSPLSFAPYRSTAIHAIELYLNALLRQEGASAEEVRGLQHDLAQRAEMSIALGLNLGCRTAAHLRNLADTRE